jgi:hypothetical protein
MLLEMEQPGEALLTYEADLKLHNNRFNGLYGAGLAADRSNNTTKARTYYQQLVGIANRSTRSELGKARLFLTKK